jgi:hypothetical protein
MKKAVLFSERQYFRQLWLGLVLLAINSLFVYGIVHNIMSTQGPKMSNAVLFAALAFTLLLTLLFLLIRLDTEIRTDGIYFRFFPFQVSYKILRKEDISDCVVTQYEAIRDYGGWGIRGSFSGKGKAYTVSGFMGIQIVMTDGKRYLLGTHKTPDALEALVLTDMLRK